MEVVELPFHKHPLLPVTRFSDERCNGCGANDYIYGGYRCNELGCGSVFHRECAESLPEINHSSHPGQPLKLIQGHDPYRCYRCKYGNSKCSTCSRCDRMFENGYICSKCDNFKLDLRCAKEPGPLLILGNSICTGNYLNSSLRWALVIAKRAILQFWKVVNVMDEKCAETNHTSHPEHPLKPLTIREIPDYADEKCLLCERVFDYRYDRIHHCDVCNFSICKRCVKNPPPVGVESLTTHEHELHLVPRRIVFTCNACGTLGDRSPYFCLQCNFMIHRQCIDLPRVININRHNHRISYTRRLGHGEEWKCKICREKVDGFYGGYTCVKCPSLAVHSLCATRKDVWDMIELEGTPDEEEIAPFEVIDDNTIKHFSHDHNLQINNNDGYGRIQPENIVCEACRLQILSEPFYSCKQCNFILHEKCANHPRKLRHVIHNQPFTLLTDSRDEVECKLCYQFFTGFKYRARYGNNKEVIIDVRCAAISDTLEHGSHRDPLYYDSARSKVCSRCGRSSEYVCGCDGCDYTLDAKCAHFPKEVMRNRYDDHPLFLSFGDMNVDSDYWCEACEAKVNPKEWFYTCNDCGTVLHISCVVGDFAYIMPGPVSGLSEHWEDWQHRSGRDEEVVSNTFICRPLCSGCKSRCKPPSILKISWVDDIYFCSFRCVDI